VKIICSYCRKDMGEKPPLEDVSVTHSMCDACYDYVMRGYKGLHLAEYLDQFDVPLFVVNPDGRILSVNKVLADMLGVASREAEGLLGGEAFLCVYSRLPGGCGKTTHCLECAIRNSIMATMESGQPSLGRSAYLQRKEGTYEVVISTQRENGLVRVQIHSMTPVV
jgi:PAS domain-containing protein